MNDEGLSDAGRETLRTADIDPAVRELRPDYRVLLIVAEGLSADFPTDHLLTEAQAHAERLLADTAVEDLPHVAAWREALRSFGAKPQRTRSSLEALSRAQLQDLSTASGVPITTLWKIRAGETKNPGIETVRLFYGFLKQPHSTPKQHPALDQQAQGAINSESAEASHA